MRSFVRLETSGSVESSVALLAHVGMLYNDEVVRKAGTFIFSPAPAFRLFAFKLLLVVLLCCDFRVLVLILFFMR